MSITSEHLGVGVRVDGRWFYVGMASVCVLIAFLGFAATYWLPLAAGTLEVAPVVHLHGAVFSIWTLFLVLQTSLVANGRTGLHRRTGKVGVAIAALMLILGVMVAANSLASARAAGFADQAHAFLVVPLSSILFFATLISLAIANIRRPDVHKRLMLIATIAILQAPIARWILVALAPADALGPPPVAITLIAAVITDLLLVAAMLFDWKRRGHVHRTYVYGFAALVAVQVLRLPVSESSAWLTFAVWFGNVTG
jgi:hypothetical protein